MKLTLLPLAALATALSAAPTNETRTADSFLIRAEYIYTSAGDPIVGGFLNVGDGKIGSMGKGAGSGSDNVIEVYAVTPGMIDLSPEIDTGVYSVEQTDETPIDLAVADALDLFSHRWGRELRSGVTTVLASPEDLAVIGGLACVLKTGGPPVLEARLLNKFGALRASMGSEPSAGNRPARSGRPRNFYTRRPTTRMGVEWKFRDTFYGALDVKKRGIKLEGVDANRQRVIERVLSGDLPVICQAYPTQDIRTACYLKEEFGIPNMILDGAAEAWRELEMLARSGVSVVLPPYVAGRTNEGAFYALDTAAKLVEAGVTIAFSGKGSRDPLDRLMHQPGWAMRGGLSFDDALRAVTINPARMVGVADRVGSLEAGKDADMVLWSGPPFETASHVIGVVLNGELVVDPRSE